jgi:hypothetical protein
MAETSDIQSTVARTRETGRIQQLTAEQEELRRKRFELERARESAEKMRKVKEGDAPAEQEKIRGAVDREESKRKRRPVQGGREIEDGTEAGEGRIDVRV